MYIYMYSGTCVFVRHMYIRMYLPSILIVTYVLFQIKQTADSVTIVRAQVLKSYDGKLEELKICKNIAT